MSIFTRRSFWFFSFSILIVVLIFTYIFKSISLSDVSEVIRNVDRQALLVFLVLSFTMSILRTWRYLLLLKNAGYRPPKFSLFLTVLARNCTSDLLPARIGTLAYIFILTTRLGVPVAPATSSFASAFLFDIAALGPLILIAAIFAGASSSLPLWALFAGAMVILVVPMVALYFAAPILGRVIPFLKSVRFVKQKTRRSITGIVEKIIQDFSKLKASKLIGPLAIISVLVRITKYGGLYVFLFALLKPLGYGLEMLHPDKVFLGICASELSASLPISGIAGFGLYQGTWFTIFELLGFPGDIAKLTSVSHHLFTQAYGYSLGLIAFGLLMLPFLRTKLLYQSSKPIKFYTANFYSALGFLAISVSLAIYGISLYNPKKSHAQQSTAVNTPPPGIEYPTLPNDIIFDSNRSGTFGLYTLKAKGLKIEALVDGPSQEMYPEPSADGKFVVFAKALTTSRLSPSDIWLFDFQTKKERLLIKDGSAPQFSNDSKTIYFERNRRKVIAISIDGSNEHEIFPLDRKEFSGYQVVKPRVSSNGKWVSFTSDRGRPWNAWIANLESKKAIKVGAGCEPTWAKDSESVVWIQKGESKGGSGIFRWMRDTKTIEEIQDAPAPLGHEYFPYLSKDQNWLLYEAAPPGQHSHVEDNYNLMAKDMRSGKVFQLSFGGATNRWPKFMAN